MGYGRTVRMSKGREFQMMGAARETARPETCADTEDK